MKRILAPILLLTLLFPSLAFGETMDDLVFRDGIHYKKFSEVPFTGKITPNPKGMVTPWSYSQGSFKNGKREGPWVVYYENGQIWREYTAKSGKNEGLLLGYCPDGELERVSTYKDDKRVGLSTAYHCPSNCPTLSDHLQGRCANANVSSEGYYNDGLKEGHWRFYDEGNRLLRSSGFYKKDQKVK
jgi:antitoxin component YwqK of YwqJK toxin-antitoxin module